MLDEARQEGSEKNDRRTLCDREVSSCWIRMS
jgi:hypothetical protein